MMNKSTEKKREKKVTIEQKQIYCSFMENNVEIRNRSSSDDKATMLWEELANLLNAENGPTKNVEQWKKVFDNWRYVTLHKARRLKAEISSTGGGPSTAAELSQLEERALCCWGKIAVEGHALPQESAIEQILFDEEEVENVPFNKPMDESINKKRKHRDITTDIVDEKMDLEIKVLNEINENIKVMTTTMQTILNVIECKTADNHLNIP